MNYIFGFLVTLCGVGFFALAWKQFRLALGLLIIALPTYLIRFQFGPVPSTGLELLFGIVFLVWLIRFAQADLVRIFALIKQRWLFFVLLAIFFAASLAGVAVSDMVLLSLGQWRAYFLEPLLLFFVLLGRLGKTAHRDQVTRDDIILFLLLSTLSISGYALFQWFTGIGIATPEWTALPTRRSTAFFSSPNAVGLYLGPVMALGLALCVREYRAERGATKSVRHFFYHLLVENRRAAFILMISGVLLLGLVAVGITKSEGYALALLSGVVVLGWFCGYRKSIVALVVVGVVLAGVVSPLQRALLFRDQSGQNRLTLWRYTSEFLTRSPNNFVFGAGVRQFFRKVQKPHYDVKKLERLIYPHNIVLNFWSEIGLFGMLAFLGMLVYLAWLTHCQRLQSPYLAMGLLAALTTFGVHGLVDVPYFKNDLAMQFWIIAALFFDF